VPAVLSKIVGHAMWELYDHDFNNMTIFTFDQQWQPKVLHDIGRIDGGACSGSTGDYDGSTGMYWVILWSQCQQGYVRAIGYNVSASKATFDKRMPLKFPFGETVDGAVVDTVRGQLCLITRQFQPDRFQLYSYSLPELDLVVHGYLISNPAPKLSPTCDQWVFSPALHDPTDLQGYLIMMGYQCFQGSPNIWWYAAFSANHTGTTNQTIPAVYFYSTDKQPSTWITNLIYTGWPAVGGGALVGSYEPDNETTAITFVRPAATSDSSTLFIDGKSNPAPSMNMFYNLTTQRPFIGGFTVYPAGSLVGSPYGKDVLMMEWNYDIYGPGAPESTIVAVDVPTGKLLFQYQHAGFKWNSDFIPSRFVWID